MEQRVCPECNKAFYSRLDSEVVACTHCGFIMHDRRRAKRVHEELDCRFLLEGRTVRAMLQDYSTDGLCVVYDGKAINAEMVIDIEVDGLGLHRPAKAVWSKKISSRKASAGLRLL